MHYSIRAAALGAVSIPSVSEGEMRPNREEV